MRIIRGKFKGRTLETLPDRTVRPTTDRVKESIFNLIQPRIKNAAVLDLFAGSGALGIEAISDGAASAVFVDRARTSIAVVNENLKKIIGDVNVINKDYRQALDGFSREGRKFDLIFLDPPYKSGKEAEILNAILKADVLNKNGAIVLERDREDAPFVMPNELYAETVRDYGGTSIEVLVRGTKVAVTGTFDPFTLGHLYLVEQAVERYDFVYIVVLVNPEKTACIPVEKRLKIIDTATKKYRKKIKIDFYSGLTIDYCLENGIEYIIRGIRNPQDAEYERQMAEYNLREGGVNTVFIDAKDAEISSTGVRDAVLNGEEIASMVEPSTVNQILAEGKKWQT